jgi:hypothetical protein
MHLEDRLRQLGFQNDVTSSFVGRFTKQSLIVDFMPLEEKVLGFNNRWYLEGFKHTIEVALDERNTVKIFGPPYFIAAKLEAFKSRGKNEQGEYDGRFSTDFEDIVFVLLNRNSIWQEIEQSEIGLKSYLQAELSSLSANPYFEEWIDAHTDNASPAAQSIILPNVRKFTEKK